MVKLKVDFLNDVRGLKKIIGSRENTFDSFIYDSRLVKGGELFFAFKTEKNDGNRFIESALKRGAKGYIGQIEVELGEGQTGIIVEDTHEFLYEIAKKIIEKSSAKIIALTGSAGKTTTKEFLAKIMEGFYKTYKTPGNFNSEIGVPLGIIEAFEENTEMAVFELGTNKFGEIEKNSLLIKPDVAAILNIFSTHLEKLGSLEGVMKAKSEIFAGLKKDGKILLNYDNEHTRKIGAELRKAIYFGFSRDADYRFEVLDRSIKGGSILKFEYSGRSEVFKLELFLKTHINNFAAALSMAFAAGLELKKIKERVSYLKPYVHRGEILNIGKAFILDDSYNSNPDALKVILDDFKDIKGKKIAIIGEILELGSNSRKIHEGIADYLKPLKDRLERIYFIQGDTIYPYEILKEDENWKEKVFFYDSSKEFRERFLSLLKDDVSILVKGSHGTNLYKLIEEVSDGFKE